MDLKKLKRYTYHGKGNCKSYMDEPSEDVYVKLKDVKDFLKQTENKHTLSREK